MQLILLLQSLCHYNTHHQSRGRSNNNATEPRLIMMDDSILSTLEISCDIRVLPEVATDFAPQTEVGDNLWMHHQEVTFPCNAPTVVSLRDDNDSGMWKHQQNLLMMLSKCRATFPAIVESTDDGDGSASRVPPVHSTRDPFSLAATPSTFAIPIQSSMMAETKVSFDTSSALDYFMHIQKSKQLERDQSRQHHPQDHTDSHEQDTHTDNELPFVEGDRIDSFPFADNYQYSPFKAPEECGTEPVTFFNHPRMESPKAPSISPPTSEPLERNNEEWSQLNSRVSDQLIFLDQVLQTMAIVGAMLFFALIWTYFRLKTVQQRSQARINRILIKESRCIHNKVKSSVDVTPVTEVSLAETNDEDVSSLSSRSTHSFHTPLSNPYSIEFQLDDDDDVNGKYIAFFPCKSANEASEEDPADSKTVQAENLSRRQNVAPVSNQNYPSMASIDPYNMPLNLEALAMLSAISASGSATPPSFVPPHLSQHHRMRSQPPPSLQSIRKSLMTANTQQFVRRTGPQRPVGAILRNDGPGAVGSRSIPVNQRPSTQRKGASSQKQGNLRTSQQQIPPAESAMQNPGISPCDRFEQEWGEKRAFRQQQRTTQGGGKMLIPPTPTSFGTGTIATTADIPPANKVNAPITPSPADQNGTKVPGQSFSPNEASAENRKDIAWKNSAMLSQGKKPNSRGQDRMRRQKLAPRSKGRRMRLQPISELITDTDTDQSNIRPEAVGAGNSLKSPLPSLCSTPSSDASNEFLEDFW